MIPKGSILRGVWRLAAFFVLVVFLMPVQAVALCLRHRLSQRLPGIFHRLCSRLFGFRVIARGTPVDDTPALFVGNHTAISTSWSWARP